MTTSAIISQILPGILISVLLLATLFLREYAVASRNPLWTRISFFLIIPIAPLLALFLIQTIFGFDPLVTPDEFSKVIIPEINLSTFSVADLTPTKFPLEAGSTGQLQLAVPTPTISPLLSKTPLFAPIGTGIPRNAGDSTREHNIFFPVAYRDYP